MHIFLIGFMGSGKSSLGVALAKSLNYEFLDLDELITEQNGDTCANLFNLKGEDFFRKKEKLALETVMKMDKKLIISCGGGTPCFYDNLEKMKENGVVIYLKVSLPELTRRLSGNNANRPLLTGTEPEQLPEKIENLLFEREQFYKQANYIIEGDTMNLDRIINVLKYSGKPI